LQAIKEYFILIPTGVGLNMAKKDALEMRDILKAMRKSKG
jgi:hypothetical protein